MTGVDSAFEIKAESGGRRVKCIAAILSLALVGGGITCALVLAGKGTLTSLSSDVRDNRKAADNAKDAIEKNSDDMKKAYIVIQENRDLASKTRKDLGETSSSVKVNAEDIRHMRRELSRLSRLVSDLSEKLSPREDSSK